MKQTLFIAAIWYHKYKSTAGYLTNILRRPRFEFKANPGEVLAQAHQKLAFASDESLTQARRIVHPVFNETLEHMRRKSIPFLTKHPGKDDRWLRPLF